jgi:hypothetical protein
MDTLNLVTTGSEVLSEVSVKIAVFSVRFCRSETAQLFRKKKKYIAWIFGSKNQPSKKQAEPGGKLNLAFIAFHLLGHKNTILKRKVLLQFNSR